MKPTCSAARRRPQRPERVRAALRARGRRGARARRHAGVRRRELERHRDRLHLRRPRHLQEVQGAGASRASCRSRTVDPRAFTPDELRDGWRLACRAPARGDLVIEVPPLQTRPKAAMVGVGRHVILRPAVQKRYLVLEEPTLEDQRSDLERVLRRDRRPRAARRAGRAAHARRDAARARTSTVTAVVVRRRADRRRAGRHDERGASPSRSTSARRRSSPRCSTSRRARPWRCARC